MRGGNHMDNQLPELKVNMLGRFSITYGEQPITFKRNSATKAVKLLQILLHSSLVEDRGSTGIPRAQLLDDLFGREELANVGNNLRVTVFRLRKMLIEAGLPEYEYIVKEKGVFISSKTEGDHGFGIENAKMSIEQNGGVYEARVEGNRFITEIIIPEMNCETTVLG